MIEFPARQTCAHIFFWGKSLRDGEETSFQEAGLPFPICQVMVSRFCVDIDDFPPLPYFMSVSSSFPLLLILLLLRLPKTLLLSAAPPPPPDQLAFSWVPDQNSV